MRVVIFQVIGLSFGFPPIPIPPSQGVLAVIEFEEATVPGSELVLVDVDLTLELNDTLIFTAPIDDFNEDIFDTSICESISDVDACCVAQDSTEASDEVSFPVIICSLGS